MSKRKSGSSTNSSSPTKRQKFECNSSSNQSSYHTNQHSNNHKTQNVISSHIPTIMPTQTPEKLLSIQQSNAILCKIEGLANKFTESQNNVQNLIRMLESMHATMKQSEEKNRNNQKQIDEQKQQINQLFKNNNAFIQMVDSYKMQNNALITENIKLKEKITTLESKGKNKNHTPIDETPTFNNFADMSSSSQRQSSQNAFSDNNPLPNTETQMQYSSTLNTNSHPALFNTPSILNQKPPYHQRHPTTIQTTPPTTPFTYPNDTNDFQI